MAQISRQNNADTPLKGMIFCCTSVEGDLRNEIVQNITAMGGIHKINLMSDVTHLIVGDRSTPKYQFAVCERPDMVFLSVSAIPQVYEMWSSGADLDIVDELHKRKLGVFENCSVCVTNIKDPKDRAGLIELVNTHQGSAKADLNKSMTQLVAGSDTGKKCEYAKRWNIPIIHFDWIRLSIRRGAALSEKYFSFDLPSDQIGKDAVSDWNAVDKYKNSGFKIKQEISESGVQLQRLNRKSHINVDSAWSIVETTNKSTVQPVKNKDTSANIGRAGRWNTNNEQLESNKTPGIFQNVSFYCYGFEDSQEKTLVNVIRSHTGQLSNNISDAQFIVVNSKLPPSKYPSLDGHPGTIVTEWFIERSLHKKTLIADIWSTPILHRNIPGFKNVNISISGFSGVELLHLERLIGIVGAQYQPIFVRSRDILISSPKSKKFSFALTWKVPIVNEKWLWECAIQGKVLPLDSEEYVIDGKHHEEREIKTKTSNELGITGSSNGSFSELENAPKDVLSEIDSENVSIYSSTNKKRPAWHAMTETDTFETADDEEAVKAKRRLVGRAVTSTSKSTSSISTSNGLNVSVIQPVQSSQVSYVDPQMQYEKNKLLEALGENVTNENARLVEEEEMTPAVDLLAQGADQHETIVIPRNKLRRRVRK